MLAAKAGTGFTGTKPEERGYKYEECGENQFQDPNAQTLIEGDAATDKWYEGEGHWDYEAGKPKASSGTSSQADARSFATMIWKGVGFPAGTTHKVGFGIKGGYALAWYCPTRPKATTTKQY